VRISKGEGKQVDARSILGVLALGAKNGDTVRLEADGDGADAVLDSLVALLEQDLDEPAPADA
jgi:phosphocarrier protein